MAIATINRLITLFDGAFKALGAPVCLAESERLAMTVQFAMDSKVRAYHTSAHIFDLVEGMNPRQVLAALFHDVVYFQLDDGFPQSTAEVLHTTAPSLCSPSHRMTPHWPCVRPCSTWNRGKHCRCMAE